MIVIFTILYKSLVKPYYKENAGTFVFVFTMFFFVIGTVDGAGLWQYHYGLATAILKTPTVLAIVLFLWLLYARKCAAFITQSLQLPEYQFLYVFKTSSQKQRLLIFGLIDFVLLLPMLFYIAFVITIGFHLHSYLSIFLLLFFILTICLLLPIWHVSMLNRIEEKETSILSRLFDSFHLPVYYPNIILRVILQNQKMVWLGIKCFTCLILYLLAVNNTLNADDLQLAFIFFSFGIFANGVLVNRFRAFEETYLLFYRGLSVSLLKRFFQYVYVSVLFIVPEIITICLITPRHLSFKVSIQFILYSFTTITLLFSVTFIKTLVLKQFIKVLLLLLFINYFMLMSVGILSLAFLFFIVAIVIFTTRYYKFEGSL